MRREKGLLPAKSPSLWETEEITKQRNVEALFVAHSLSQVSLVPLHSQQQRVVDPNNVELTRRARPLARVFTRQNHEICCHKKRDKLLNTSIHRSIKASRLTDMLRLP